MFYRIDDSPDPIGRWHLSELLDSCGRKLDPRHFTAGIACDLSGPLKLELLDTDEVVALEHEPSIGIQYEGIRVDWTFSDFDLPIITAEVGELLSDLAPVDIQRIPLRLRGGPSNLEILNIVHVVDCIDEKRSKIQWFQEGNSVRPDLAGQPEMITDLRVIPSAIEPFDLVRPKGWEIAIVISERISSALAKHGVSGIGFTSVS